MMISGCKTNHSFIVWFLFPFSSLFLEVVLSITSTTISTTSGPCPNMCQGHGSCEAFGSCHCEDGFLGADCSLRSCPYGPSWSDMPISTNGVAHPLIVECSNRGICNRMTGKCECFTTGMGKLFEGPACERTTCPHNCRNRGSCVTLSTLATLQDPGLIRKNIGCTESDLCESTTSSCSVPDYSQCQKTHAYNQPWEANMIQGCFCDDGFEGFDCSIRSCPTGDNPRTTINSLNDVQYVTCKATSGTFTLQFRGETTKPISAMATASQFQMALARLTTLHSIRHSTTSSSSGLTFVPSEKVTIHLRTLEGDTATTVCSEDGTQVQITFLDNFGDLSLLLPDGTQLRHSSSDTPLLTTQKMVTGTKENDRCSNHGLCNYQTGSCHCIHNYTSSDGYNRPGNRGDCGYDGAVPTTSCPNDCSKYGICSGSPEFQCECQVGHGGADCSLFTCPQGKSWFSFPR